MVYDPGYYNCILIILTFKAGKKIHQENKFTADDYAGIVIVNK
jgi:hypothetical protein